MLSTHCSSLTGFFYLSRAKLKQVTWADEKAGQEEEAPAGIFGRMKSMIPSFGSKKITPKEKDAILDGDKEEEKPV